MRFPSPITQFAMVPASLAGILIALITPAANPAIEPLATILFGASFVVATLWLWYGIFWFLATRGAEADRALVTIPPTAELSADLEERLISVKRSMGYREKPLTRLNALRWICLGAICLVQDLVKMVERRSRRASHS